jgi:GNAT superfamily N-acetyltransferase
VKIFIGPENVFMEIGRVVPEDIDGFYDLFSEVIAEGIFLARKSPPPKEAVYRALVEAQGNDWAVFVACHENETIGSAEAYPESFCKAGGRSDVALLGMQVKHSFRARGVGSRLLVACLVISVSQFRRSWLRYCVATPRHSPAMTRRSALSRNHDHPKLS